MSNNRKLNKHIKFAKIFKKIFRKSKSDKLDKKVTNKGINKITYNKDLVSLFKGKKKTQEIISKPELYILNNVAKMREEAAEDILIPRVDIIAVEKDINLDELLKVFTKYGYSRLPVYNETLDDTLGFVHVKDLINVLKKGSELNIASILRPVLFVSPYIKIVDLLFEMIAKRNHIAMVVDEFGGIDGLITIEDIIEEIVGDITDEHDKFSKKMILINKAGYLEADARLSVAELEEIVGKFLTQEEKDEVDTVGGLITFLSGRVGHKNEIIKHPSGIEFEILAADPLKVIKIGVHYKGFMLTEKQDSGVED